MTLELYYYAYSVAYFVVSQEMGSKTQMAFLDNLYEDEKEFILPYYKGNKRAFISDVLYFEDYLIDKEKLDKEFPVVKKDIKASGRRFDIEEKMSEYPEIDLFFMIMRLRLLYVSGQGYTRMKLRTLLKHYGYKRRSAAITKHIQDCLTFYHIQTCLKGGQDPVVCLPDDQVCPCCDFDHSDQSAAAGKGEQIYASSTYKEIGETTVIGDITVRDSKQDGIYADEYIDPNANPVTVPMFYDPKTNVYVRGDLTMENAGPASSGIAAFGGTVIVDGNVKAEGSEGPGPMGIYAEGKRTIVLVTEEITAPVAVLIPGTGSNNSVNNARVYAWRYQDSSRGKTEQIGFVLKIDDKEELKDIRLESGSKNFVALERDGRTYYGAFPGDTITVRGAPDEGEIWVLDADNERVEITDAGDGTYTFKVPDKLGALVTYHKHTPGDPEKEASCEEAGSYEEAVYCTECGEELSRRIVAVDAAGHK